MQGKKLSNSHPRNNWEVVECFGSYIVIFVKWIFIWHNINITSIIKFWKVIWSEGVINEDRDWLNSASGVQKTDIRCERINELVDIYASEDYRGLSSFTASQVDPELTGRVNIILVRPEQSRSLRASHAFIPRCLIPIAQTGSI